jgi:hypothetical protein
VVWTPPRAARPSRRAGAFFYWLFWAFLIGVALFAVVWMIIVSMGVIKSVF